MKIKSARRALLALAMTLVVTGPASAATDFPTRPIRIIVPYPAGGLSDFQVRAVTEPLGKLLGQPIIVDNRPGASAGIGTRLTKDAPPDGYTLVFVNNGFVINPLVQPDSGYDPVKDFSAVSLMSTSPMVMVVNSSVPAKNVAEFISYAKAQPSGVEYGSAGTASFGHMATALFSQATGLKMTHVPYKGEAPMSMALRTGEVKVLITTPSPQIMGAVKDGSLKLLGVASSEPAPLLPGVKQISDTVPGFTAEVWFGLFAPKGTPADVITKINAALAAVLARPDVKEKYASVGATAEGNSPAAYQQMVSSESKRWAELIAKTGIKAE